MSQFNFGWVPLIQQELRKVFASKAQGTLAETSLQPEDIGTAVQAYDADLSGLASLNATGIVLRDGAGLFSTSPQLPAGNLADGAVTLAKLAAAVQETLLPPGAVAFTTQSTAPTGWLKANGAALNRTTYAGLFSAIGTTYGVGDGSTTFNLPDLRGEFLRALDDGRGVDSARALGSAQAASQIPSGGINAVNDASYFRPIIDIVNPDANNTYDGARLLISTSTATIEAITYTMQSVRPRNVALLAIIKY